MNFIMNSWAVVMDSEVNPLSNIKDLRVRHMVMQILAWMWCVIFTMMSGTWLYLGVNILFHTLLLGGICVTVAMFETAKRKPDMFKGNGRASTGEHE
jgi:hypothetical protein|tara:strand:+ start:872 stop:1162 length:291 start_codon:yes stop_codon:yes gene_type:complete